MAVLTIPELFATRHELMAGPSTLQMVGQTAIKAAT